MLHSPTVTSNGTLVNGYLRYARDTLRRSPSTIYTYHRRLTSLVDFLGAKPLSACTVADLNAFCARPRRAAKMKGPTAAAATLAGDVMVCRNLFRYLYEIEEVIARNVALKMVSPTIHNENPHPVPHEVWRKMWFSDLDDAERVALGLGYFCGFRRAEITQLHASQLTDVLVTSVLRKGGKRDPGFRWRSCIDLYDARLSSLIGNPSPFIDSLSRLRRDRADAAVLLPWADERVMKHASPYRHQPPFDGFLDPGRFNKRLDRITHRLGLPRVAPHDLRHSFCTNLCSPAARVPVEVVSKLAGHSDIRITMRYVDLGRDPLGDLLNAAVDADSVEHISRWG